MQLVDLAPLISDAVFDLRYNSSRNIIGKPLDNAVSIAQLDKDAAEQLVQAAGLFRQRNLCLVIWDAYRPSEVQEQLRAVFPGTEYVLEESNHCRGLAIDLTLATLDGRMLDMGTDHDDFSLQAHPDATGLTAEQQANRALLISVMQQAGFVVWPYEWWHFDFEG